MEQEQEQQQPREEQPLDDGWKIIREKQLKKLKHIFYRRLAHLGVPMPPDDIMVLIKSAARSQWVNPLLYLLRRDYWSIDNLQDYLDKQSLRALFMMPVIMVEIMVVSICNPTYASLGIGLWFWCIYVLCTLTYLVWLRYKKKLVEKYQVSIAKWALELRKELQADQYDDDGLINSVCNNPTKSAFQDIWMCCAVSCGFLGVFLCGDYYLGFWDSWIRSGCILGSVLSGIYSPKPVTSNDDELKVSMEQPPDDYGKQRLADLGVPMPPGMVLKKSNRYLIPILEDLVVEERKIIVSQQEYHNRNAFIAFVMMPVIFVVTVVVSICNPSFASLGVGLWFCCMYVLCTLTYLVWLTYKEKLLEKYRLKIAEWVLKTRKELPTVEVDNVGADQHADDLINRLCYRATIPLNISYSWIYSAVLVGILGIVFCGDYYYWNAY